MLQEPAESAEVVEVSVATWTGFGRIGDGIEADHATVRVVLASSGNLLQCILQNVLLQLCIISIGVNVAVGLHSHHAS